ncbi:unnamed protein product [Protopolystoma xenopodis]|uniref:Uncharacterized protein n=1 Tax=Protopolystoma xenopodis TaxID=117903 RepID=A0A3S5A4N5_9PLAT|nr:unnamed protein product [Protopolystoma xenopodis]
MLRHRDDIICPLPRHKVRPRLHSGLHFTLQLDGTLTRAVYFQKEANHCLGDTSDTAEMGRLFAPERIPVKCSSELESRNRSVRRHRARVLWGLAMRRKGEVECSWVTADKPSPTEDWPMKRQCGMSSAAPIPASFPF